MMRSSSPGRCGRRTTGSSGIVTRVAEQFRAGRIAEAREIQSAEAGPQADRLERLTNQLVNLAEAEMLAGIGRANGPTPPRRWW